MVPTFSMSPLVLLFIQYGEKHGKCYITDFKMFTCPASKATCQEHRTRGCSCYDCHLLGTQDKKNKKLFYSSKHTITSTYILYRPNGTMLGSELLHKNKYPLSCWVLFIKHWNILVHSDAAVYDVSKTFSKRRFIDIHNDTENIKKGKIGPRKGSLITLLRKMFYGDRSKVSTSQQFKHHHPSMFKLN